MVSSLRDQVWAGIDEVKKMVGDSLKLFSFHFQNTHWKDEY